MRRPGTGWWDWVGLDALPELRAEHDWRLVGVVGVPGAVAWSVDNQQALVLARLKLARRRDPLTLRLLRSSQPQLSLDPPQPNWVASEGELVVATFAQVGIAAGQAWALGSRPGAASGEHDD